MARRKDRMKRADGQQREENGEVEENQTHNMSAWRWHMECDVRTPNLRLEPRVFVSLVVQHWEKCDEWGVLFTCCVPARVSWVYLLDSSHLQQHPTSSDQAPLDSATTNDVSANVSDVLRFLVFLQHFLLLSWHCRFVLEHQSSSLGNVIEFPSSCTFLGSKRSIQLLHLIMQQASANMTCVATNVCLFSRSRLSCSSFQAILQPNQSPHAPATLHLTFVVLRQHASPVLHQVSTQPFEFLHVTSPRFFHMSREALHCFSNVNSVLSNIR